MASIEIDHELLRQVRKLAAEENRSVDSVVKTALEQYVLARTYHGTELVLPELTSETRNPLLRIAEGAELLGDLASEDNVSERSRDILNTEFPEYLMNRMRRSETEDE